MFINIVEYPPIKKEKEQEFREWFRGSSAVFSKFEGFVSRKLLVSDTGAYAAIVEHQSKDTFMKMRNSREHAAIHAKGIALMDGEAKPSFYTLVELSGN